MSNITELVDRYIAVWNEPDAEVRRRSIAKLWAEDGATTHKLLDARGYEAIEARVAGAHEKWVRTGGFVFKSRQNVVGHHNVVKFNWEMAPAGGGEAAAVSFDFFVLDDDGRIRCDYQFIEPSSSSPDHRDLERQAIAMHVEAAGVTKKKGMDDMDALIACACRPRPFVE